MSSSAAPRRTPGFWTQNGVLPRLLSPLGWIYGGATAIRLARGNPLDIGIPVICVGNLTAGGTGKTPVVRDLAERLRAMGRTPHILTRGYGGTETGPHRVDPAKDGYERVGDEALILAKDTPVWVGQNRQALAMAAVTAEADVLIQDDGYQDPALKKSLSLVCVDAAVGFGNGRMIPAGPLRESVARGLGRADAIVMTGEGAARIETSLPTLTCQAKLEDPPKGTPLAAFCGLGRPEKFFESLTTAGAELAFTQGFPDHYPYHPDELTVLARRAEAAGAQLVTTEKDGVRLPDGHRDNIRILTMGLEWSNDAPLYDFLTRLFD